VKTFGKIIGATIVGIACVALLPLVIVFAAIASIIAVVKAVVGAIQAAIKAKPDNL